MTAARIPLAEQADPWLTEKEAATELRVSPGTVRNLRVTGRLSYARVGDRRLFYPLSAINEYRASIVKRDGPCQNTDSLSEAAPPVGISVGPKVTDHDAHRQVRKIMAKLSKSSVSLS